MKQGTLTGFVIVATLLLQGCATTIGIKTKPESGQETMYESGTEAIVSAKKNIVAVRPEAQSFQSTGRPSFIITVQNRLSAPIVFSTKNVTATSNGAPLKVFTYDELVAEVEKQQTMQAFAAALAGVGRSMSAARAGNQYHYGSFNSNSYGNVYSPYGSASYSGSGYGTYSGYSYNAAAAQQAQAAAQAQTNQDFDRIAQTTEAALSDLENTILRKQTVFPNQWHGGYIRLDQIQLAESGNELLISVEIEGEEHSFNFALYKVEK